MLKKNMASSLHPRKPSAVSQVMRALHEYVENPTPIWHMKEQAGAAGYRMRVARGVIQRRRAQALANEVYRAAGLSSQTPTPQEAAVATWDNSPATFTLLAEDAEGRAAATVSLVFDSPDGLPCDAIFNSELSARRLQGRQCVEVTRLAIREEHKANKLLLVRLFNLIYLYTRRIQHCDDFVIEVHPRHARFYEALLGFTVLGSSRPCPRVNGSPAVLLKLDLALAEVEVARLAGRPGPRTRSLYPLFYAGHEEELACAFLARHPAAQVVMGAEA